MAGHAANSQSKYLFGMNKSTDRANIQNIAQHAAALGITGKFAAILAANGKNERG
jgi:hypothetical protein